MTSTSTRDHKRAAASSLSYFLAQIASKGLTFFTFMAIARYFGEFETGRYTYISTSIGFFALFVDLGINSITVREIAGASEERAGEVLVSALTLKAFMAAAAAAAAFAWARWITQTDPATRLDLMWYSLALFASTQISSWSEALQLPFQARLQMWTASIATVFQRALFFGAVILAIRGHFTIRAVLAADIVTSAVIAVFLAVKARALFRGPLRVSPQVIRSLIVHTAPLAISFPVVFLYLRAEIFYVNKFGGFSEVGRLSAGTRLVDVFGLLPEMLIVSLFPLVVRASSDGPAMIGYFRKVFQWLFLGLAPVAIGAWFFSEPLLVLPFGPEYAQSAPVFKWAAIALVCGFPLELATMFLVAIGQQRWRVLIYVVLVIATGAAGPWLIAHHGAVGAAWLRILTRSIGAALLIGLVRYHRGGWIIPANIWILAAPAALVACYATGARMGLPWLVNAGVGALLYVFLVMRLELVPSISYVRSSMSEWRAKRPPQ